MCWVMGPIITNCDWPVTTFKEGKTMNSLIPTIDPDTYADRFREWNARPDHDEQPPQQQQVTEGEQS